MSYTNKSMSLAETPRGISVLQRIAIAIGLVGFTILLLALLNVDFPNKTTFFILSLVLIVTGVIVYSNNAYLNKPEGIKNDATWFKSISSRGIFGWIIGIGLTIFYVLLYYQPQYLGLSSDGGENTGIISFFDPLSKLLSGNPASQWFVYGTLYTVAILVFGYKFILKYRHNKYEVLRTISVMFFQLAFAFLIPEFLIRLNYPYYDFKNMWPLQYDLFSEYKLDSFLSSGNVGLLMLVFGIVSIFIVSPILTYFYGKRWYCSWVCGCGGLAETAGDPFRHLSSKKLNAWKLERWTIHLVLVFAVAMTIAVIYSFLGENHEQSIISKNQFIWGSIVFLSLVVGIIYIFKRKELNKDAKYAMLSITSLMILIFIIGHFSTNNQILFVDAGAIRGTYGFLIGAAFSGVVGVGFYPIFGSRVWCRFGCPMAAILGIQQRLLSKFRITTNGGQCISCGNCSTYCEMGIDVRAYAQKGENIVRASCVGCGVCAAVCPRGVLKLENKPTKDRINSDAVLLGNDVDLLNLLKGN